MLDKDANQALAGATPYLRLFSITAGGCLLAQQALAALRLNTEPGARVTAGTILRRKHRRAGRRARAHHRRRGRRRARRRSGARPSKKIHVHVADHPSGLSRPSSCRPGIRNGPSGCARSRTRWRSRNFSRSPACKRRKRRSMSSRYVIRWTTSRRRRRGDTDAGHRASRRRHVDVAGHVRCGFARRRRRHAGGRRGGEQEGRQCFCRHAAARPSCRNRAADGLLYFRQCRHRRPLRAKALRHCARGDRRFRRASRQRLAGNFLGRQDGDVLLDASDAALSRYRRRHRSRRIRYGGECAASSRRRR